MLPIVRARVVAVRRRLRLQASLDGAARAAVVAGAVLTIAVYAYRLGALGRRGLVAALAGAAALVVLGALVRAAQRIPLARAAKRIDLSHGLHDRIGSALAFSDEKSPTPFMQAAIADAAEAARTVEPRRAAPFSRPRALGPATLTLTCAGLVALLRFPAPKSAVVAAPPSVPHLVVDPELLQPERESVRELAQAAKNEQDQDTAELAKQLDSLLAQLDRQELTRKQVFDQLAQIEKKLQAKDGDLEDLQKQLKKAGDELAKSKLTKDAGEALKKEDLAQAKKELEKLAAEAEKLAAEKKNDAKREELARSLERASKEEQSKEDREREQEMQRLQDEQRRLKRELEKNPNDEELTRRLKRNQRELERLEREKQARAEQRRELQRLQRELEKAAEQLRQKLSPEAAEALRQAAQAMRQMEQQLQKLGNQSRARVQIAELKEVLRRAGQSQQGQSGSGRMAQNGQPRAGNGQNGQNGKGQNGKGQNGKGLLKDFNDRAGGGEQTLIIDPQHPGGNGPQVLLPLPGQGTEQPGQSGKDPGQSGPQPGGDGIGDQHDPNVMGDQTKLAAKHQLTRVDAQEGAGPSKSETIMGSAQKGFASRNYKRVYSDYSSVVEEVMSKERVPPGYRYYVKRYFQLIKPRE